MNSQYYNSQKIVQGQKEIPVTWSHEHLGKNNSAVSRWLTNNFQLFVGQSYYIAHYIDVDDMELLVE